MDSDCSIWVLYPFNDIWEMAEKCLDSETALHISGHVYHQQSNVTCDRDVGVSSPSHPNSKTSTMLSAWALSLPQTALWASWSCPGCRRNLSPWRSPTTSFVGCHLCVLSLSHPPFVCQTQVFSWPTANSSRSGSFEQQVWNNRNRIRLSLYEQDGSIYAIKSTCLRKVL